MIHLGTIPASTTVYIPFTTYAGSTGASVTCTGLAVTDVEIYKNGSTTQRSSDAGIVLLDTDGIDFDGITGLHGFSIDLSDNTDASFYAVGSFYWVVVSAITVDSQTVTFLAATFRIGPAESITGYPKGDVHAWTGTAVATPDTAGYPKVTIKDGTGAGEIALTSGAVDSVTTVTTTATATNLTNLPTIPANWLTAAGTAADFVTEVQSGLATPTNITAGTITTVTNLTNAPTAGDFTATMKTSITTAATSSTPSVTVSDKTGFSLSAAGVQAIWDALTSALTTVGSIGKLIVDNLNATISSRLASASYTAPLDAAGTRTAVGLASANLDTQIATLATPTNITAGTITTVTTLTGHTPQTGDSFARLGAPVGASLSADIAAIKAGTLTAASKAKIDRSAGAILAGTVGVGSTTTTIVTSALSVTGASVSQLNGRIVIFDDSTTTAALRGQATEITSITVAALPVITVTALTTAPASTDTFTIT